MNNITCFTDEISRDFETAVDVLVNKNVCEFDLRNMRTGRVPYISIEEEKELDKILINGGHKINTMSPAVGKLYINDPDLKYRTISHLYDSVAFAKRHNIKNIIVFSFKKLNKYYTEEKMPTYGWDILDEIIDIGIRCNVNILIENHSSCFVSTTDTILQLKNMKRFEGNISLNWDPNNSYQITQTEYAGEYNELFDIVKNIHLKDTIYENNKEIRVPLGEGKVGWNKIFDDLRHLGYKGKYTIETHYKPYIINASDDIERLKKFLSET